jgi:hypothetical protein
LRFNCAMSSLAVCLASLVDSVDIPLAAMFLIL